LEREDEDWEVWVGGRYSGGSEGWEWERVVILMVEDVTNLRIVT